MAFTQGELLSVAGVLVVLFGVIVYNNARAAKARRPDAPATSVLRDPIVGRFVHHQGNVMGEVIALDGDHAILVQGHNYSAVPAARLLPAGDELVITGELDWTAAHEKGRAWRKGA